MRGILSWAAVVAVVALPISSPGQQADSSPAPQAQTTSSDAPAANSGTMQSPAPPQESVAEAARRAREAKKEQAKPAKVFDNDNMPGGTVSTVGKTDVKKDASGPDASDDTSKSGPGSEKTWKDKFALLRAKLARDKEDLEVMQRELGVLNLQNYSDPNKGLQQELTRSDINNKTAAIDAKQKAIEADQQAIDDAEEDLRKSGGDSGWAR
jgi:hypothetical protein